MKTLSVTLLNLFLIYNVLAGNTLNGKISGQVLDEQKQPLPFVTMMLLQAQDSSLVKGEITDPTGNFNFEKVPAGEYIVAASMIGYSKTYSNFVKVDEQNKEIKLPATQLEVAVQNLQEVTVVGQKPFIEQQIDKTVINVENSIVSSGSNALEILEKAPGVTLDKDDKISLKGKQGVIVMIDGKPTHMSEADVANMLRNMPSNSVEKVEIITNPSAKYDAAGNSGIINIRLKKDKNMGMNGNLTAGAGYGDLPKYNAGLNLNYRNGKFNVFGNYNYSHDERFNSNKLLRTVNYENNVTIFDQYSYRPWEAENHSYKLGFDFFLNKKHTIGVMTTGFDNTFVMEGENETRILNGSYKLDSSLLVRNNPHNDWSKIGYNLNYKFEIDSTGKELTVDVDYSKFNGGSKDNFVTNYFNATGEATGTPLILRSNTPSTIEIRAAKIDYVHPLGKKAKFETGLKSSYVTTDNNVRFENYNENNWEVDLGRTNQFQYTENINAAYINFSQEIKKFGIQLGMRAEQTISEGNSVTMNKVVKQDYLELFPSVFVSQNVSENHKVNYSYSRRIDRPNYRDLNPFIYFLDEYTYFQGNPFLKPQFTNKFEVAHTYKNTFTTTIGYSKSSDVVTEIMEQIDSTKATIVSHQNLNTFENYNLGVSAPVEIAKWWSSHNNLNLYYNQYKSKYLGGNLDMAQWGMSVNSNHNFKINNSLSAELSGWYQSPGIHGLYEFKPMYSVNAGIQKTFMDKKATIKVNVNDIFNTMRFRGNIDYMNMKMDITSNWESRQARVTFTYRFGKGEVKPARNRQSGAESEQNRVNVN